MPTILVTGGAGFIGSNFARYWRQKHPEWEIIVYDKLTYAGIKNNLHDLEGMKGFQFVQGDICDKEQLEDLVAKSDIIVNFAAESHVDRSLVLSEDFIKTDVLGVHTLLRCAQRHRISLTIHVSTDEVYGPILDKSATETFPLNPTNPYSASKAGGDLIAMAYYKNFKLPVIIARCCNNFGPYQHPEKFIPLMITNALMNLPLPIYGDGRQVREWIFVEEHCSALDFVIEHGTPGEIYNIGTGQERQNIEVAQFILKELNKPDDLIVFVKDRPAHDRRYSLDCSKLKNLGWRSKFDFEPALVQTVRWYIENDWWWRSIRESKDFQSYYEANYAWRLKV